MPDCQEKSSTLTEKEKLRKLRRLFFKVNLLHPVAINKAHSMLAQYPDVDNAINGIIEGELPNLPLDFDYTDYYNSVLKRCPELKTGIGKFFRILSLE